MRVALCKVGSEADLARAGYIAQKKLDGRRCILVGGDGKISAYGRRGNDITKNYPELNDITLPKDTILDGEIVVGDSFNDMQNHQNNGKKATFYCFDLLLDRGQDTRKLPYRERRKRLEKLDIKNESYKLVEEGTPTEMWERAEAENWEGIVEKEAGSYYPVGRTESWIKIKRYKEMKGVPVLAYTSEKRTVSAIVTPYGNVNVASPDDQAFVYDAFKKGKKLTCEVDYLELSKENKFRFPILRVVEAL